MIRQSEDSRHRTSVISAGGYVIVRDPDTEVVKKAMNIAIETIQVEYA